MLQSSLFVSLRILACIFIILIVAGTALDLFRRKMQQQSSNNPKDSEVSKWLLGFSSYTNSLRLFDTSPPRGDQIGCLDGIRFWSMCWVLVSHCYSLAQFDIPLHNTIYITTEVCRVLENDKNIAAKKLNLCVSSLFVSSKHHFGSVPF